MSDTSCYVRGKEVTIRPALLEDYNEVLDIIPHMYEGNSIYEMIRRNLPPGKSMRQNIRVFK